MNNYIHKYMAIHTPELLGNKRGLFYTVLRVLYIHKKYILLVHDVHTYCLRMNYFIRPLILVPRECRTRTRPAKSENQGRLLHEDEAS